MPVVRGMPVMRGRAVFMVRGGVLVLRGVRRLLLGLGNLLSLGRGCLLGLGRGGMLVMGMSVARGALPGLVDGPVQLRHGGFHQRGRLRLGRSR